MLLSLFIKNFGLIDQLEIEFQPGINIISGETGAGKSIIIEALHLAAGGKIYNDQIRSGFDGAVVQAAFDISKANTVVCLLKEQGIVIDDENVLIMSREINRSGKNFCRVNGQIVQLGFLKKIGLELIDFHVQHEQNTLLNQGKHLSLIDRFGGQKILNLFEVTNNLFFKWKEARSRLAKLSVDARDRARRLDALKFQIDDIDKYGLYPGEDEKLIHERNILINTEKIYNHLIQAYSLLNEGINDRPNVVDLLAQTSSCIKVITNFDQKLVDIHSVIDSALYQVEDVVRELSDYLETTTHNPERLGEVMDRLEQINRMKKKYGGTIEEVLQYHKQALIEIEELENTDEMLDVITKELKDFETKFIRSAEELSILRRESAQVFEELVSREMNSLDMKQTQLKVCFTKLEEPTCDGQEKAEFMISTNPGEPLKSLARIASGGELARIMLAIKSLVIEVDGIPVLVIDEVDAGIGGRALQSVAQKISQLGNHYQVICVTHSAQVARHGKAHFRISKRYEGERTNIRIKTLDKAERIEEFVRMLGGNNITEDIYKYAKQMLENS